MKHLILYICTLVLFIQMTFASSGILPTVDPPSYKAPNGKTYTWSVNFDQLSEDYTLAELVTMPVWICCGNTSFEALPNSCRKGILNSGIKPHQVQNLSPNKTYTNSLGNKFTPDAERLRLYGFCMVESDSRGIVQTVDINAVCDELRDEMIKAGQQPCDDLTPQNVRPDYDRQLIYYTVCGETFTRPMTGEFTRPNQPQVVKEIVKEVVNCDDEFVNLPLVKICEGESYEWNIDGQQYVYSDAGTYIHSTSKADNCGKINNILNIDFYEPINTTIVPEERFDFAAGETYTYQDIVLDAAGTYERDYVDANGCNAIATIVLREKEAPQVNCPDCVSNAKDLGNIEVAARLNYGKQPISPDANAINDLGLSGGLEAGLWKDWRSKRNLMEDVASCNNNLFEYGIIGGIASRSLIGEEPSECNCNNASEGSAIHAYIEPGVRWHLLGLCDRSKILPIPVIGTGLRLHYNDHNIDDISRLTVSPKAFAEGRWYFNQLLRSTRVLTASDVTNDNNGINSLFFAIGGEAFAPGFTFGDLNYNAYLKLGYRF